MSVLEKYYRINQAAGVSIHIHPDGRVAIQLSTIIAKGNQLNIEKKIVDLNKVDQLIKHLSPNTSVALNLSGKGILQKQIDMVETVDQGNFNKILPNAGNEDFYIQNFISGESSFVSVVRKADADRWINQLNELGFKVMMLSLGPFPIENIVPQLNIYGGDAIIDGNIINRNEKAEWTSYQYSDAEVSIFPLKIESEKIDEKLVIPYASAFQLVLANQLDPIKANVDYLDEALQKKLGDIKLKVQGFIVLIVFFLLLLVNFIALSWLNSSNNSFTNQASLYAQNTSSLQQLNEQVKKKEGLLHTLGWEGGINKSVLVDQICSLLPEEIKLTEIAVDPIDQAGSRRDKAIVFYSTRIAIVGNSDKIIPVNEWIARMKTKPWVKNINLESYAFDNELNTGRFAITLDY